MDVAEAATWPYISRIRAHCYVEMTLDKYELCVCVCVCVYVCLFACVGDVCMFL